MAMVTLLSTLDKPLQPRQPRVPNRHAAGRNRFTTASACPIWCKASTALVQRHGQPMNQPLFPTLARTLVRHCKRPFHSASIDVD